MSSSRPEEPAPVTPQEVPSTERLISTVTPPMAEGRPSSEVGASPRSPQALVVSPRLEPSKPRKKYAAAVAYQWGGGCYRPPMQNIVLPESRSLDPNEANERRKKTKEFGCQTSLTDSPKKEKETEEDIQLGVDPLAVKKMGSQLLEIMRKLPNASETHSVFYTLVVQCVQGKIAFAQFLNSSLFHFREYPQVIDEIERFFVNDVLEGAPDFFPALSDSSEKDLKFVGLFCTLYKKPLLKGAGSIREQCFQTYFEKISSRLLSGLGLRTLFLSSEHGFQEGPHLGVDEPQLSRAQFTAQLDLCMLMSICFNDNPVLIIDFQGFLHPYVVQCARTRFHWPNSWPASMINARELKQLMTEGYAFELVQLKQEAKNLRSDIEFLARVGAKTPRRKQNLKQLEERIQIFEEVYEQIIHEEERASSYRPRSKARKAKTLPDRRRQRSRTPDLTIKRLVTLKPISAHRRPPQSARLDYLSTEEERVKRHLMDLSQEMEKSGKLFSASHANLTNKKLRRQPVRRCRVAEETNSEFSSDYTNTSDSKLDRMERLSLTRSVAASKSHAKRSAFAAPSSKRSPYSHSAARSHAKEKHPRDETLIRVERDGALREYPVLPVFSIWKPFNFNEICNKIFHLVLAGTNHLDSSETSQSERAPRSPGRSLVEAFLKWLRANHLTPKQFVPFNRKFIQHIHARAFSRQKKFMETFLQPFRTTRVFGYISALRTVVMPTQFKTLDEIVEQELPVANSPLWHKVSFVDVSRTGVFTQAKPARLWSWELPWVEAHDLQDWGHFDSSYYKNPNPEQAERMEQFMAIRTPVEVLNQGRYVTRSTGTEGGYRADNVKEDSFSDKSETPEPSSQQGPPLNAPTSPFHYSQKLLNKNMWANDTVADRMIDLEENMLWAEIEIQRLRQILLVLRTWMCAHTPNTLIFLDEDIREQPENPSEFSILADGMMIRKKCTRLSEKFQKDNLFLNAQLKDEQLSPYFEHHYEYSGSEDASSSSSDEDNPPPDRFTFKRPLSGPPPPDMPPLLAYHLKTIYGEEGRKILKALQMFPFTAAPVLYKRLLPLLGEAEVARTRLEHTTWKRQAYKFWRHTTVPVNNFLSLENEAKLAENILKRFDERAVECIEQRAQNIALAKEKGAKTPAFPFPLRLVLSDPLLPVDMQILVPEELLGVPEAEGAHAAANTQKPLKKSAIRVASWDASSLAAALHENICRFRLAAKNLALFETFYRFLEEKLEAPSGERGGLEDEIRRTAAKDPVPDPLRHNTCFSFPSATALALAKKLLIVGHRARTLKTSSLPHHLWRLVVKPLLLSRGRKGASRQKLPNYMRILPEPFAILLYYVWLLAERLTVVERTLGSTMRLRGIVRPSMGSVDEGRFVPPRSDFVQKKIVRTALQKIGPHADEVVTHPGGLVSCAEVTGRQNPRYMQLLREFRKSLPKMEFPFVPPNTIPSQKASPPNSWELIGRFLAQSIAGDLATERFRERVRGLLGSEAHILFSLPSIVRNAWEVFDSIADIFVRTADVFSSPEGGDSLEERLRSAAFVTKANAELFWMFGTLFLQDAQSASSVLRRVPPVPAVIRARLDKCAGARVFFAESWSSGVLFVSKVARRGAD
eukprot:gnl/Chilomastix_cuspidata/3533.p1 GENE.gnl/Chilomastix_cuspidata/3533~~gnl/Chilomastix_cuspidata/3533.p1  ORF type:complete len:1607 (+),score=600.94 gnl/Chilomastix_cuspidata/3533:65-4885(+)